MLHFAIMANTVINIVHINISEIKPDNFDMLEVDVNNAQFLDMRPNVCRNSAPIDSPIKMAAHNVRRNYKIYVYYVLFCRIKMHKMKNLFKIKHYCFFLINYASMSAIL